MLAVASALLLAAAPPAPIILTGPPDGAALTRSSVEFTFRSTLRTVFECKVTPRAYEPCRNTYTATGLTVGTYTFSVRALDSSTSEPGPPAERTFTITAIDDDGDGYALPADCDDTNPAISPGGLEIPGNGIDENCDGFDGPPPVPTPDPVTPVLPAPEPTPAPAPLPAPAPTPVAQPKPKLSFTLSYFMRASRRDTRFSTLSLKGVPRGATIKVTCAGGCPRKRVTLKNRRGTVALTAYRNRALRAGAKLTIAVTKPGSTGMVKVVKIRAGKRPTISTKTVR